MKRSTIIITAMALTFGIVGGAVAYGKYKFGDPAARAENMVSHISDELTLDSTQEQSLIALMDELMATRVKMRGEMQPTHHDVKDMIAAEIFDQTRALEMISNKTATVNEMAPGVIATLGTFLDGLNAEQKAEMVEFIEHKVEYKRGEHYH